MVTLVPSGRQWYFMNSVDPQHLQEPRTAIGEALSLILASAWDEEDDQIRASLSK